MFIYSLVGGWRVHEEGIRGLVLDHKWRLNDPEFLESLPATIILLHRRVLPARIWLTQHPRLSLPPDLRKARGLLGGADRSVLDPSVSIVRAIGNYSSSYAGADRLLPRGCRRNAITCRRKLTSPPRLSGSLSAAGLGRGSSCLGSRSGLRAGLAGSRGRCSMMTRAFGLPPDQAGESSR